MKKIDNKLNKEKILFGVKECSLEGVVLAAMSVKGICLILIANNAQEAIQNLQLRFPDADCQQRQSTLEPILIKIIDFIDSPQQTIDFTLDLRGSSFQLQVWQALRKIPLGQTASYSDIARQIGAPKAARAVAQACANNALAIVIPCHRVIRNDGSLSGYRWGKQRKQILLRRESSQHL